MAFVITNFLGDILDVTCLLQHHGFLIFVATTPKYVIHISFKATERFVTLYIIPPVTYTSEFVVDSTVWTHKAVTMLIISSWANVPYLTAGFWVSKPPWCLTTYEVGRRDKVMDWIVNSRFPLLHMSCINTYGFIA